MKQKYERRLNETKDDFKLKNTPYPNEDALYRGMRLVLLGADPKTRDETGKTLKDYAKQTENGKLLKFLEAVEETRNKQLPLKD